MHLPHPPSLGAKWVQTIRNVCDKWRGSGKTMKNQWKATKRWTGPNQWIAFSPEGEQIWAFPWWQQHHPCNLHYFCVWKVPHLHVYDQKTSPRHLGVNCLFPLIKRRRHLWNEQVNDWPQTGTISINFPNITITFLLFYHQTATASLQELFAFVFQQQWNQLLNNQTWQKYNRYYKIIPKSLSGKQKSNSMDLIGD